ncbi:UNVERIFIED_CONTAM: hypothetical protein K2H54_013559 [Gekko kuhli]
MDPPVQRQEFGVKITYSECNVRACTDPPPKSFKGVGPCARTSLPVHHRVQNSTCRLKRRAPQNMPNPQRHFYCVPLFLVRLLLQAPGNLCGAPPLREQTFCPHAGCPGGGGVAGFLQQVTPPTQQVLRSTSASTGISPHITPGLYT